MTRSTLLESLIRKTKAQTESQGFDQSNTTQTLHLLDGLSGRPESSPKASEVESMFFMMRAKLQERWMYCECYSSQAYTCKTCALRLRSRVSGTCPKKLRFRREEFRKPVIG